jgi:hypothetical protein
MGVMGIRFLKISYQDFRGSVLRAFNLFDSALHPSVGGRTGHRLGGFCRKLRNIFRYHECHSFLA